MTFDYDQIPASAIESLRLYIDRGYSPGHFLTAVLSNDLTEAVRRADDTNLPLIPTYVAWLYGAAPYACWGSPARVTAWMTGRQAERERVGVEP